MPCFQFNINRVNFMSIIKGTSLPNISVYLPTTEDTELLKKQMKKINTVKTPILLQPSSSTWMTHFFCKNLTKKPKSNVIKEQSIEKFTWNYYDLPGKQWKQSAKGREHEAVLTVPHRAAPFCCLPALQQPGEVRAFPLSCWANITVCLVGKRTPSLALAPGSHFAAWHNSHKHLFQEVWGVT